MSGRLPDDDHDSEPRYRDPRDIPDDELRNALSGLYLLGDDPYLRMQAFNLAVVDQFIMGLESDALQKLMDEERTPIGEAVFLSAQSQMWMFAVYEVLRTWRERSKDIIKLVENGGLASKIAALEKDVGFMHVGRKMRTAQLKRIEGDPKLVERIRDDLLIAHMAFARLEFIRVSIAKHEVSGRRNSIAYAPGYGRINSHCGSLDYQMEQGRVIMGDISRRDIADDLRAMAARRIPTKEELDSFGAFMKGPPADAFD